MKVKIFYIIIVYHINMKFIALAKIGIG